MLKLSKQSDYGLILLEALAQSEPKAYISLTTIATKHSLPYKFLGQIATKLAAHHLIKSKEGSGGGYSLAKKPASITLDQVVTALDGPIAPTACMKGRSCRCVDSCLHADVMRQLSTSFTQSLKGYTLADLLKS
jgi:Rrf2 family protein